MTRHFISTVDEFRASYARSNNNELRTLLDLQPERLAPEARQALAEEAARRGLEASGARGAATAIASAEAQRSSYPKAPNGDRFAAYIIDQLIGFGPVIIAGILGPPLQIMQSKLPPAVEMLATFTWAVYYALAKDGHGNGQSIGKKVGRLMVIDLDTGEPCNLRQSITRGVISVVLEIIPYIGLLIEPGVVLGTSDGRRLADRAAGTQVISTSVYEASVR